MVVKGLKEMFGKEKDQHEENGDSKDEMTLYNLVRGEGKRRLKFLVTVAEGGRVYIPTRITSMMIKAVTKEEFKPKRNRNDSGNKDKQSTHTYFESP